MNKRPPTPEETRIFRLYHKHFHPDLFINHTKYGMVHGFARLVNRCYEESCGETVEFITEMGLALKDALKGA